MAEGVAGLPFRVLGKSDDIHRDGAPWPDDIVTGYQAMFDKEGTPVLAMWLERTG